MKGGLGVENIKELLGCSKCGCLILPDATKCPNCGVVYNDIGGGSVTDNPCFPSKLKIKETGVEAIVAYYHFACPHHGRVHVRATVTTPTIRCPFC